MHKPWHEETYSTQDLLCCFFSKIALKEFQCQKATSFYIIEIIFTKILLTQTKLTQQHSNSFTIHVHYSMKLKQRKAPGWPFEKLIINSIKCLGQIQIDPCIVFYPFYGKSHQIQIVKEILNERKTRQKWTIIDNDLFEFD